MTNFLIIYIVVCESREPVARYGFSSTDSQSYNRKYYFLIKHNVNFIDIYWL